MFLVLIIDMTFDDDVKLFGLMRRYSDESEADELQRQVIEYVRAQIHDVQTEISQFKTQSATAESASAEGQAQFDGDVSNKHTHNLTNFSIYMIQIGNSPEDGMLELKKRQKMARLQRENQATQQQPTAPTEQPASVVNLTTCDLGASPNLQPKVMKPYRYSPLLNARMNELRKKNKGNK